MSTTEDSGSIEPTTIAPLQNIVQRNQVWPVMAAKYGVENPVPPWKTSLDGLCDALDDAELQQRLISIRARLEA